MLRLGSTVHARMVAHCLDGYPEEACGLLGGRTDGEDASATECFPTRNAAASARVYAIDPLEYRRVEDRADAAGLEVLGVFHSHTHTAAYPSPTDVERAEPAPMWHYVLVSLADEPVVRSYRIVDGKITEEPVVVDE